MYFCNRKEKNVMKLYSDAALAKILDKGIFHVLEAPFGDEAEPPCGVALALQLFALAVLHHLALALAKLAQHLDVNAIFPEFLFHRQSVVTFGAKVRKVSETKVDN